MKKMIVHSMKTEDISSELLTKMWNLYNSTYDFVDEDQFYVDFKKKNYVFVGYDKLTGEFKGFSTALLYTTRFHKEDVGVIFSGDTIIHPDYWGSKALHMAFLKLAISWKLKNPMKRLYWNLIASGNRTYLAMARNCANYYPRFDRETPSWEKEFINHIGAAQFGPRFDSQTGVIVVDKPEAVLKTHLAPFTNQVKNLPEINFFIKRNKGYEKGDELSCIASMDLEMVTHFSTKILKKNFKVFDLLPKLSKAHVAVAFIGFIIG